MIPYQWTIAVLGVSIAAVILWLVRREHLRGPYAVWWLTVSLVVLLLSLLPEWVDRVGGYLGIAYPPILPVVVGVGLLLIKILTSDLQRSRQEIRFRRLVQRVAMLEGQLAVLRESLDSQTADRSSPHPGAGHGPAARPPGGNRSDPLP